MKNQYENEEKFPYLISTVNSSVELFVCIVTDNFFPIFVRLVVDDGELFCWCRVRENKNKI